MIRTTLALTLGLSVLFLPQGATAGNVTTTLTIEGMHCALCAPAVTKALERVDGVKSVEVSVEDKRAVVVADEAIEPEALVAAVAKAGFEATAGERK
jgi:copper chaperone CopZ